jgi:hypothetical protein
MTWRGFFWRFRIARRAVWFRVSRVRLQFTSRTLLLIVTAIAAVCGVLLTPNPLAARIAGVFLLAVGGLWGASHRHPRRRLGSLRGRAFIGAMTGGIAGLLLVTVAAIANWWRYCALCNGENLVFMTYWWASAGTVVGSIVGCLLDALQRAPRGHLNSNPVEGVALCMVPNFGAVPDEDQNQTGSWRDGAPGVLASLFFHVALINLVGGSYLGWGRAPVTSDTPVELVVVTAPAPGTLEDVQLDLIDDSQSEVQIEPGDSPGETEEPAVPEVEVDVEPPPSIDPPPELQLTERTWLDASGQFEIDAKVVRYHDGCVYLERKDGGTVPVPLSKLSDADARYVQSVADVLDNGHATLEETGYSVRAPGNRAAALKRGGGTGLSEDAVERALQWLARHQNRDGSWSFCHTRNDGCSGFANPGSHNARCGATGLAVLTFLGSGHVHTSKSTYQSNVSAGIAYLLKKMVVSKNSGRLYADGANAHMYCHGIAACALTEAYGTTLDPKLRGPAQLSLNYIIDAQHPVCGGWAYLPRQGGDTSIVGWQVMALKSGRLSYLRVPDSVMAGAKKWLDQVESKDARSDPGVGCYYGYRQSGDRGNEPEAMTAVGLLCRTYLGTPRNDPGLRKGLAQIVECGPNSDMYYNYYATLALFQSCRTDEYLWERWNAQMRDHLIRHQTNGGRDDGSWYFNGGVSRNGGRLFMTAVAAMTLQVYYRYPAVHADNDPSASAEGVEAAADAAAPKDEDQAAVELTVR